MSALLLLALCFSQLDGWYYLRSEIKYIQCDPGMFSFICMNLLAICNLYLKLLIIPIIKHCIKISWYKVITKILPYQSLSFYWVKMRYYATKQRSCYIGFTKVKINFVSLLRYADFHTKFSLTVKVKTLTSNLQTRILWKFREHLIAN